MFPLRKPLLNFDIELSPASTITSPYSTTHDPDAPKKHWYHYLPLCGTLFFMLGPQPSVLYILVGFHIKELNQPLHAAAHAIVIYTLLFLAFSSLFVCAFRDPGSVTDATSKSYADGTDEELDLTEALMPDIDFSAPGKWCRKCWAPKPERTHHCSMCGRCVLKMDHHCPWLGNVCIGHRTYPAFIHFILSTTLLAAYLGILFIWDFVSLFNKPGGIDDLLPLHMVLMGAMGVLFGMVLGSFFGYHVYLVCTNQTTLENISPYLILKYLPPLPRGGHGLSDPPLREELSSAQRYLVRDAHSQIRIYNLGWRRNLQQALGLEARNGWLARLWHGGSSPGDGKNFPRNPSADRWLESLAQQLVTADKRN